MSVSGLTTERGRTTSLQIVALGSASHPLLLFSDCPEIECLRSAGERYHSAGTSADRWVGDSTDRPLMARDDSHSGLRNTRRAGLIRGPAQGMMISTLLITAESINCGGGVCG